MGNQVELVMLDDAMRRPFANNLATGSETAKTVIVIVTVTLTVTTFCPELPRQPRHPHRGPSLIAKLKLEPALPQPDVALGYQPS